MTTISVRVDEKMLRDLENLQEEKKTDRSEVIRRLLDRALREEKFDHAMELLREHKISIGKAAEMAGVSIYEVIDAMKEYGVTIGYTMEDLQRDIERFPIE